MKKAYSYLKKHKDDKYDRQFSYGSTNMTSGGIGFGRTITSNMKSNEKYAPNLGLFNEGFKIWKKSHGYPDTAKVFIILGGYSDMKKAMLKRGMYIYIYIYI